MTRGRIRRAVLWFHLALGLTSGLIIVVIGLTGAILAFNNDYVRWTHPGYFGVKTSGTPIGLDAVVAKIEQEYAPSRVESINLLWKGDYVYYFLNDRGPLIANTVDGRILDPRAGQAFTSKLVINATQVHTKLAAGDVGRVIRNVATIEVLFLIPTGIYLWWPAKRFGIRRKASWRLRLWDLHNTLGVSLALPVLFLALTGSLIALHLPESRVPAPVATAEPPPRSVPLADADRQVAAPLDAALTAARGPLPELQVYQIMLPDSSTAPIVVNKSPNGWSTRNQRASVYIDRYSGEVLRVNPPHRFTPAYRLYDFGRRLHGGQYFNALGKAIFFVSSLSLSVLAVTGLALGIRRLKSRAGLTR